jgi:hypothetical protein
MAEAGRPTGIKYEDAIEAAQRGGNVDFEGSKVRVVSISARTGMHTPYSARLDLDLGDEYVVLLGYFRGGEFIEEGRERPSGEATQPHSDAPGPQETVQRPWSRRVFGG